MASNYLIMRRCVWVHNSLFLMWMDIGRVWNYLNPMCALSIDLGLPNNRIPQGACVGSKMPRQLVTTVASGGTFTYL